MQSRKRATRRRSPRLLIRLYRVETAPAHISAGAVSLRVTYVRTAPRLSGVTVEGAHVQSGGICGIKPPCADGIHRGLFPR